MIGISATYSNSIIKIHTKPSAAILTRRILFVVFQSFFSTNFHSDTFFQYLDITMGDTSTLRDERRVNNLPRLMKPTCK